MRRLLIISTTFFPDPSVPAIRMTQWCRHLPEMGWKPYVLCRYYGYEATAEQIAASVHSEVSVTYLDKPPSHAEKRSEQKQVVGDLLKRLFDYSTFAGLVVPDVSIYAWRRFRGRALAHVRAIKPDVIITTSPPHSNHEIGAWLARETGIPWVADFRDPYLLDERFRPRGFGRLRWPAHERFKQAIYRRAWLVIHAIPIQARWIRLIYPFARRRIRVVTNGFPAELLNQLTSSPGSANKERTILVAGTIPEPEQLRLAQAVAMLSRDDWNVKLKLIGKLPRIEARLRDALGDRLVLTGYLPHRETIRAVAHADLLVNYLDTARSRSLLLSTKLFEYLATGKPVIAINSSRSERLFLRSIQRVKKLTSPNIATIAKTLAESLKDDRFELDDLEEFRQHYNWTNQVRQVASWLEELVAYPDSIAPLRSSDAGALATIVIATRNRRDYLRKPILSALNQSVPVEVIVVDDGSTDGTAEMVRTEFPTVRLIQHELSRGYIIRRNEAAQLASTPVIFSIDDDALFSSSRIAEQTLQEFDDPRIGAVAIPCVDVRREQTLRQPVPNAKGVFVTDAFIGTAHAVRRDVFLRMGGYRSELVHQGEERDFCLRMLNQGWVVRVGGADPIYHFESQQRDVRRMDHYGRRNDVLFAWQNVPLPYLPLHLLRTSLNGVRTGFVLRRPWAMISGLAAGYRDCFSSRALRRPVKDGTYRLHMDVKKHGPKKLADIEDVLPPMVFTPSAVGSSSFA